MRLNPVERAMKLLPIVDARTQHDLAVDLDTRVEQSL
jgi:hypothetical protein